MTQWGDVRVILPQRWLSEKAHQWSAEHNFIANPAQWRLNFQVIRLLWVIMALFAMPWGLILLGAERTFKHMAGTGKRAVHCWRWLENNSQNICLFQPGFSTSKRMYGSHERPFITETQALPSVPLQFSFLFCFFFFCFLNKQNSLTEETKQGTFGTGKARVYTDTVFLFSPKRANHRRTVTQISSRHDVECAPSV